ncbi:MAG TPA: TonB-dependent receptor [Allosphingosinicella sp.]|nr:TonB-dependent receptor [Allosphingosinicella sp.]
MTKFALLFAPACLAVPAAAQPPAPAAPPAPPAAAGSDHVHTEQPAEIVVTANFVRDLDLLAGTEVLSGAELVRDLRPQIGDTLARLPGVSATSFSPGASRPVLRGFQGERIRVLTDGVGSIDVSNTSADHAVTIDPLTAERIEVLHGPAVLLFGSQAIGGAVNVLDRRIPRRVPDDAVHVDALLGYGSAADEKSAGVSLDLPLGNGFVGHVDASYRDTDDLEVGGFVLAPPLRAEQLALAEEEEAEGHAEEAAEARALANRRGRIPNSATETKTLGAGFALIRDGGSLGVSVSWYDTGYGVPARPGAGHHHEEEGEGGHEGEHGEVPVTIGLEQIRADLRGEIETGGGLIEKLRVRLAAADYEHTEFEGAEVGTVFATQGMEGRIELIQADRGGWRGVSGIQYFARDFAAVGAEAFVPPNQTSQLGLFTLQEFDLGRLGIEAAARWERTNVSSNMVGSARKFDAFSGAVGASYEVTPRIKVGANASHSERAPSAEELFSKGPHIATQAFEIGDPGLAKEKSWGAEAYVRADTRSFNLSLSAFANWFNDYIFEAATGEERDELPVFRYFQRDALYYGFEGEVSATLFRAGGFRFVGDLVADYVRASIKQGGPVPRIPPLRLLGGIEAQSDSFDARVEAEWSADQDRVAAFETPTDGHILANASLAWRPWGKRKPTTLMLSANNIFDVDARRHASFTKDFVPLAGRDIRLSARFSF